jgi:exosortase K
MLTPTAQSVGVVTGTTFALQPGEGYFSRDHMFLIEKSCAGINFMVAALGLFVVALFRRVRSAASAARVLGISMAVSYLATVVVNTARIAIAMWLAVHRAALPTFDAADVHRLEGIIVYFGGLVLLYELVAARSPRVCGRAMNGTPWINVVRAFRRMAVPLASYYAVTLALPLANGAAESGAAFVDHALVVLVVPPLLIVLVCVVHTIAHTCCSYVAANQLVVDTESERARAEARVPGRRARGR